VIGIIQGVSLRVGEPLRLLFEIAPQHRHVARIELRIDDATHVSTVRRIIEVVKERRGELRNVLTERLHAVRVPTHRRIRAAQHLEPAIGQAAHGFDAKELFQNHADPPAISAVALNERCEGALGATYRKDGGLAGLRILIRRVAPPPREHALGTLAAPEIIGAVRGAARQNARNLNPCKTRDDGNARNVRTVGILARRAALLLRSSHVCQLDQGQEIPDPYTRFQQPLHQWIEEPQNRRADSRLQSLTHQDPLGTTATPRSRYAGSAGGGQAPG
jgi:hypothetical protein